MPFTSFINSDEVGKAAQDRANFTEQNRASRMANENTQSTMDANAAAQQAIRAAYLAATPQQAGTPPDALQNAQAQQTVQSAAALPPPAQSPTPVQMSGTAIPAPPTPAQIPNAPQGQQIPQVPASDLARTGSNQPNGLTSQAPQTRNPAWASPFHGQQFQQQYEQNLMNNPNAGSAIQKMKADADAVTAKVMEMAAMGNVDEAKFVALRNGMEIPDNILQNADLTKAVTFAQKAYPNESDKGQIFYQAYMQNPGDTMSKVQAGIHAAGRPENTAQRELNKSLALAALQGRNTQMTQGQRVQGILAYQKRTGKSMDEAANDFAVYEKTGTFPKTELPAEEPSFFDRTMSSVGNYFSGNKPPSAPAAPSADMNTVTQGQIVRPISGTPAQSPMGGQSIRVKNPTTGEAFDIQPADLPNAMQEGFQIEQQ